MKIQAADRLFLENVLGRGGRTDNCTVRDGFSSQVDVCMRQKMEFCYNRSSQHMGVGI